jgi:hypothetical protein
VEGEQEEHEVKQSLNRTQVAGLLLVGLSLVTLIGGEYVSSWLLSAEPSAVHIYVKDAETGQHIAKELVTVTLTGFNYFGVDQPFYLELRSSRTKPTYWGFTSNLYTSHYVSITATGYVTQTGSVSMPQNSLKEYTFKLSPEPQAGEPEPEPVPPDEPEPVPLDGSVEAPESNPVDEAVREALGRTTTLLSASLACMGIGVYLLGTVKEEKRR